MLHSLTISTAADQALAWLLTYALHSTLLLVSAWAVTRRLGGRRLRLQETIWRCALLGALVTAPAQLALGRLGHAPIAGRWTLAAGDRAQAAPARPLETATAAGVAESGTGMPESPATAAGAAGLAWREGRQAGASRDSREGRERHAAAESAAAAGARRPLERTLGRAWTPLRPWLLPAWLLGALALTLGYGRSYLALRRRLRYRPQVVGGGVVARLAGLVRQSGLTRRVRLTCTWRLRVPVALGLRAAEVCVPPRALFQLDDEQQDALLAHELAHLARRDPAWLPLTQVVVAVFFFQPLNWLARRRLGELSELLSDEWAVARTGRPLSLAGCLAEVAGWSLAGRGVNTASRRTTRLPVPGMAAGRPSQLAHRIRRLLDGAPPAAMTPVPLTPMEGLGPARRRFAVLLAAVPTVLLAVTLAAPGVSADSSPAPATAPACSGGFASTPDIAAESAIACGGQTAVASAAVVERPAESAAPAAPTTPTTPTVASAVAPGTAEAGTRPAARASMVVAALAPAEAQGQEAAATPAAAEVDARSAAPASPSSAAEPPHPEAAVAGTTPATAASAAAPRSAAAGDLRDLDTERERLAAAAARLQQLDKLGTLSREQIAAITASVERISREIDGRLGEQLEQLNHQLAGARAAQPHLADLPVAEMAELGAELAGMTAQLHPSAQEMAEIDAELRQLAAEQPHLSAEEIEHIQEEAMRGLRQLPNLGLSQAEIDHLHAEVKRSLEEMPKLHLSQADLDRLRGEMKRTLEESAAARSEAMSPAEREKLVADARRLAERLRPDQAQLEALRKRMRHEHEELTRSLAEQRAEIEAMRRELQQQTQALRDQARRLTDSRRAHPKSSSPPRPPRPAAPASPAAPAAPAAPAGPAAPAAPAVPTGAAPPAAPGPPPAPEALPAPEAPPPPPSCAG
ncbi:MAG TPA: M56 family metallopeptidase [Thermoanaerobaculia bacterium]